MQGSKGSVRLGHIQQTTSTTRDHPSTRLLSRHCSAILPSPARPAAANLTSSAMLSSCHLAATLPPSVQLGWPALRCARRDSALTFRVDYPPIVRLAPSPLARRLNVLRPHSAKVRARLAGSMSGVSRPHALIILHTLWKPPRRV